MFFIVMGILEIIVSVGFGAAACSTNTAIGIGTILGGAISGALFIAVGRHSNSVTKLENKVVILEDKQKFIGRRVLILEAIAIQKDEKDQLDEVATLLKKSVVDSKGFYNALYNGYLNAINHAEYLKDMLASVDEKYTESNKTTEKKKEFRV